VAVLMPHDLLGAEHKSFDKATHGIFRRRRMLPEPVS